LYTSHGVGKLAISLDLTTVISSRVRKTEYTQVNPISKINKTGWKRKQQFPSGNRGDSINIMMWKGIDSIRRRRLYKSSVGVKE
jgi:hypothetical protein